MTTSHTITAAVGPQMRPQKATPAGDASGDAFLAMLALLAGGLQVPQQVPVATASAAAPVGEAVPASTTVSTAAALATTVETPAAPSSGPTPVVVSFSPTRPENTGPTGTGGGPEGVAQAVIQPLAVLPGATTQGVRKPEVAVADMTTGVMTEDLDGSSSAEGGTPADESAVAAIRQILGRPAGNPIAPEQAGGGESQPSAVPAKPGRARPVSLGTAQPAPGGKQAGAAVEDAQVTPMGATDAARASSDSLPKAKTGVTAATTESAADALLTVAVPADLPASPALPGAAPVPGDRPVTAAASDAALAPAAQIAPHVLRAVADGRRSLTVQLHPADLGGVEITVETRRDGDLRAHLTVDRPEALRQLRDDAPRLVEQLRQAGLELGQSSLSFDLRRDGGQSGTDRRPDLSANQPGSLDPPPPADAPARQRAHAATSLLDVLV